MKDAHEQVNFTLTIINEMTIHIITTTAKRPVTDEIFATGYDIDALPMDPYALHANVQIIGWCVVTKGNLLQVDLT